jgi:acetyl-CoA synthetase
MFWLADFGWIMGPLQFVGVLACGGSLCLYEGVPDWPGPGRMWELAERHEATVLGTSPTLIRSLMQHGDSHVHEHDLSRLRILGSTGEPWNVDPWNWYFSVVGDTRCPVINISGGTEVGACFLSPHPVEPIAPMSVGGPALGMAVDVYDENGRSRRDGVGELVCTKPWPGMTRGLWNAADRYIDTYWSRWPDVWVHGDWASVVDGQWYLHGRSDDTINVAGKRLGPAEVESAIVAHAAVVEAAAFGMPDPVKGERLWVAVVLNDDWAPNDDLAGELRELVATALGASFRPAVVTFVRALPKTRSAKVVRRAVRAVALGHDPGDTSALEDPDVLDELRGAFDSRNGDG